MKHQTLTLVTLLAVSLAGKTAHAQTLSLSPAVGMAAVGDTVTFSVLLSDGPNVTSNLGAYGFTLSVDKAYLFFVNSSAPFTANVAAGFTTKFADTADNTAGTLRTDYAVDFEAAGVNEEGKPPLTLGTFSAMVIKPLPASGTVLSFAPVGTGTTDSALYDAMPSANLLQATQGATLMPTPEPSENIIMFVGAVCVGLRAIRRRCRE